MTDFSLKGLHIINTRPKHQAAAWSQQLRALGASVTDIPAIEIAATKPTWLSTILPLEQFEQIIFVSVNAVDYFISNLTPEMLSFNSMQVSTVGKHTASHLDTYAINPLYPSISDSAHLLEMPHLQDVNDQSILIVKGVGGRRLLSQKLIQRGAKITQINVYRRLCPKPANNLSYLWQDRKEKIILVTSKVAVDNLFQMMPDFEPQLQQTTWLVLSQRIANYARKKKVKNIIISDGDRLITKLTQHQQGLAND